MTRVKHGLKYQKLCHIPTVHFPQEREGSLTAKSPNLSANNMVQLNRTHSFLKLQTKFSNLRSVFWQKFPANYANPTQFAHILHE